MRFPDQLATLLSPQNERRGFLGSLELGCSAPWHEQPSRARLGLFRAGRLSRPSSTPLYIWGREPEGAGVRPSLQQGRGAPEDGSGLRGPAEELEALEAEASPCPESSPPWPSRGGSLPSPLSLACARGPDVGCRTGACHGTPVPPSACNATCCVTGDGHPRPSQSYLGPRCAAVKWRRRIAGHLAPMAWLSRAWGELGGCLPPPVAWTPGPPKMETAIRGTSP